MPGSMSVGGLVSGLKTDDIIAKIMEYARQPQTKMLADKAEAQNKLAVWQSINTRVLALKLKSDSISSTASFSAMTVTSSDSDIVTASASSSAVPGTYFVKVTSRAQAHEIASQSGAYTSMNDAVGTGAVKIRQANGDEFTVNLDANNNTLAGLRDAINKADKSVHATIINSGSVENPNYRMMLTSTTPGLDSRITLVDTTGLAGGTAPTFNQEVQAASNAVVELGEGAGKITVSSSTNTVADLIPGVTLNVLDFDAGKTVRIDVGRNTAAVKSAIQDFVAQYNDLSDAIGAQFDYDAETGESGALMGDFMLQSVQMDIESMVTGPVSGLDSKYGSLAAIGITLDTSGHLSIDDAELNKVIQDNPTAVSKLFSANLESSSSYISLAASTADTQPSGAAGWQVQITQAARRAQVTAGTTMSNPLEFDETLTINGEAVSLAAGDDLDDVIAKINLHSGDTNAVAARTGADGTGTGDYLSIRRLQYGSNYTVSVLSSLATTAGDTTGFGNQLVKSDDPVGQGGPGTRMLGLDVAGIINGAAATGRGQILSLAGDSDNAAAGVSLLVTASSAMAPANVVFSKGVGASVRDLLVNLTSSDGSITTAQDGLNQLIADYDDSIESMESRFVDQESRLYAQFSAMEAQLAKLQDQGNYIASQVSAMNKSK